MTRFERGTELAANLAIVSLVALIAVSFFRQGHFEFAPTAQQYSAPTLRVGETVKLSGLFQGRTNLVLVVQPGCKACGEEMATYRELLALSNRDFAVVAVVLAGQRQAEGYLRDHGLSVDRVTTQVGAGLRPRMTPTVVVVDHFGKVAAFWEGRLNDAARKKLTAFLQRG